VGEKLQCDPADRVFNLFVVLVLYKMKPNESIAFNTLQGAIDGGHLSQATVGILLYDNTPGGQDIGSLPAEVQYRADPFNSGLARAYNYALDIAEEKGFDWLLTLDQDTSLPVDFLSKLRNAAEYVAPMPSVAAIVPQISSDGRLVSPFTLTKHWTLTRLFPDGYFGIPLDNVYAANSATATKVSALRAVGGYDPSFYFYFADFAMNRRLHSNNFRTLVAGDIHVEHELSGFDLKNRTTLEQYDERCRAEEAVFDEYMGRIDGIGLMIRIIYRLAFRIWKMGGSLAHFKIGLRFLCRRLFCSRKHRMESWRKFLEHRNLQSESGSNEGNGSRPEGSRGGNWIRFS
jgi:GT2 family glycosyltransferase